MLRVGRPLPRWDFGSSGQDLQRGRRGVNTRSMARTSPSVVCGSATAWTVMPCPRAAFAVTGPMQTVLAGRRTVPPAATKPRTVEALVKVTASIPPASRAFRAAAGRVRGKRVR